MYTQIYIYIYIYTGQSNEKQLHLCLKNISTFVFCSSIYTKSHNKEVTQGNQKRDNIQSYNLRKKESR